MLARSDHGVPLDALADLIERHGSGAGTPTAVPRQTLVRVDTALEEAELPYVPMVCFVAGGAKRLLAAGQPMTVRSGELFVGLVEMPMTALFEPPYRAATLILDGELVAGLIVETAGAAGSSAATQPGPDKALATAPLDAGLVDAVTRWVALLDQPRHIQVLSRRIEEEIVYRVLAGPLGAVLRAGMTTGHVAQVRSATAHLARHLHETVTLAEVARVARVSPATLLRHFKRITGTSPLQFHKQLRLQRARQLIALGDHTAASAAAVVGYASPSQFNRDYRRLYGEPPLRHAGRR